MKRRYPGSGSFAWRRMLSGIFACALLASAALQPAAAQTLDALPKSLIRYGSVSAVVLQTDGKIVVGGDFQIAGSSDRTGLARFNANGTVDATWNPKIGSGEVQALAIDASGNIYVGGTFSSVTPATGQGLVVTRRGLAKINGSTGAVDSWTPAPLILATSGDVSTSDGQVQHLPRAGTLRFRLGDRETALAAYDQGHELFIPFRDATSGNATYGAGRYVEAHPLGGDRYEIDFNTAYNPYCAYNENWSCPLPPRESWLDVPIRAGEMAFH